MQKLFTSPLRVYLAVGLLAVIGILSGLSLSISLFPNADKPFLMVNVPTGMYTNREFLSQYGLQLESAFSKISKPNVHVAKVSATYLRNKSEYDIDFEWGTDADEAQNQVQLVVSQILSSAPDEIKTKVQIQKNSEAQGFFAMSFYSQTRPLSELYDVLEPILSPHLGAVPGADGANLYNPLEQELRIQLDPKKLAAFELMPSAIETAIRQSLISLNGGVIQEGSLKFGVTLPRQINAPGDINAIQIKTAQGSVVRISQIAKIELGPKVSGARSFLTDGAPSLILFATPKPGSNVKAMAEELKKIVESLRAQFPKDVETQMLVDPSEYIRASITNVIHEVLLASMLAVLVLFLFIGSFRNVITAAIEIPLSIVLAFILMRLFGVNINMISLAGLALSAGMNVDASVVVMENIFKKFEKHQGAITRDGRIQLVCEAVREVRTPILASTITSIIVFFPLAMTAKLTHAILGDLALAVIFSHGFSALIAMVLVPTIRLHLFKTDKLPKAPLESVLIWMEKKYKILLSGLLKNTAAKFLMVASFALIFVVVIGALSPKLKQELVGQPDSEWIILGVSSRSNHLLKQMESLTAETLTQLKNKFSEKIDYTFTPIEGSHQAHILIRLKNPKISESFQAEVETFFQSTPEISYFVGPWNPSEMPIPNAPDILTILQGGTEDKRQLRAQEINQLLQSSAAFSRVKANPSVDRTTNFHLDVKHFIHPLFQNRELPFSISDLSNYLRIATDGVYLGKFPQGEKLVDVSLQLTEHNLNKESVLGLPIGLHGKILPIKALFNVHRSLDISTFMRKQHHEVYELSAYAYSDIKKTNPAAITKTLETLKAFISDIDARKKTDPAEPQIVIENPFPELTESITQLKWAIAASLTLMFFVLLFQFGSLVETFCILLAIPFGIMGAILTLFIFKSTLSLNSALGIILLNGIAVANSILLIDFMKTRIKAGVSARIAAIEATGQRLRPILITSLTTILGMLPIAIGMGQGGKVLQPLGLSVAGGMFVSLIFTLFFVPMTYVTFIESRNISPANWIKKLLATAAALKPTKADALSVLIFLAFMPAYQAIANDLSAFEITHTIVKSDSPFKILSERKTLAIATSLPNTFRFLPEISSRLTYLKSNGSSINQNNLTATAGLSVGLFHFGENVLSFQLGGLQKKAAESDFSWNVELLHYETLQNVLDRIRLVLELELLTSIITSREKMLNIAKARYLRGLISQQDVDKLSIDASNLKVRQFTFKDLIYKSDGRYPGHEESFNKLKQWPITQALMVSKKETLKFNETQKHPALEILDLKLQIAEKKTVREISTALPKLDLNADYYFLNHPYDTTNRNGSPYVTLGLTLTVPLFSKFENLSSYRVSLSSKNIAALDYELKFKSLKKEQWLIKTKISDIETLLNDQIENSKRSINLTRLTLLKFERGLIGVDELTRIEERFLETQIQTTEILFLYHRALIDGCETHGVSFASCQLMFQN